MGTVASSLLLIVGVAVVWAVQAVVVSYFTDLSFGDALLFGLFF